jgi:ABC-2 type transport system permease protein
VTAATIAHGARRIVMRHALHAEWTKLRTQPGMGWLLLAIVTATAAMSAASSASVICASAGCGQDPARVALAGIDLGQALVAVLAVHVISGEYRTGLIGATLIAMPGRTTVLAAKAVVVIAVVTVAGTIAVLASVVSGWALLPDRGFTSAHGYRPLSLGDGQILRAATGSVLYLMLIALLSLGIATAVRDSATAIGLALGLLYLFPIIAGTVSDPRWHRRLEQIGPMNAGLAIQNTVDLACRPLGPWAGLGVLAGWSATMLLLGGLQLRSRDA